MSGHSGYKLNVDLNKEQYSHFIVLYPLHSLSAFQMEMDSFGQFTEILHMMSFYIMMRSDKNYN